MTLPRAALAAAALLATAAPAASASDTSTVWAPVHVAAPSSSTPGLSAFANGVGYVAGTRSLGTSDVGTLPEQTERTVELHRTTDYGRTWTRLAVPGGTMANPRIAFATPTEGWMYDRNELLRSTDSGATWSPAGTLPLPAGEVLWHSFDGFSISRDGAGMVVAGHVRNQSAATPADPCGDDRGQAILFSDDDGATWNEHRFPQMETGNGVSVESVRAIGADTAVALTLNLTFDSGCWWSADDRRLDVHVTVDGGATWTTLDPEGATDAAVTAATVTGTGVVLVALDDGSIRRSTDGGATFTTAARVQAAGLAGTLGAVSDLVFAGSTGYATLASGATFRSTDDGATWAADGIAGADPVINALKGSHVAVFDGDDAFAVGAAGVVTYRMS